MPAKLSPNTLSELRAAWDRFAEENPGVRSREVAAGLGCSEADLVATGRGSLSVRRLDATRMAEWLAAVAAQPHWMWLVRNEHAVLEKDVDDLRPDASGMRLTGADTELRLDAAQATDFICLLTEPEQRLAAAVQVFNAQGEAVLKIYLKSRRDKEAAMAQLQPYTSELGEALVASASAPVGAAQTEAAPQEERMVARSLHTELIEAAAAQQASIELSAANTGAHMRVRLTPENLKPMDKWFNIMDRGFNLHLQEPGLVETRISSAEGEFVARILNAEGQEALRIALPAKVGEGIS